MKMIKERLAANASILPPTKSHSSRENFLCNTECVLTGVEAISSPRSMDCVDMDLHTSFDEPLRKIFDSNISPQRQRPCEIPTFEMSLPTSRDSSLHHFQSGWSTHVRVFQGIGFNISLHVVSYMLRSAGGVGVGFIAVVVSSDSSQCRDYAFFGRSGRCILHWGFDGYVSWIGQISANGVITKLIHATTFELNSADGDISSSRSIKLLG
jgi:hypothetical protein